MRFMNCNFDHTTLVYDTRDEYMNCTFAYVTWVDKNGDEIDSMNRKGFGSKGRRPAFA